MIRRILAGSRFFISIAVLGSFLTSIVLLVYGGLASVSIAFGTFTHLIFTEEGGKHLAVESVELIDLFLLGTVLYIIALGLYELFIDEHLPMPSWLTISDIDELKEKLIGTVIVLLAVSFLANVVVWNGNTNILPFGVAVGLVMFALGYLIIWGGKNHASEKHKINDVE